jgi:hypothetical protein
MFISTQPSKATERLNARMMDEMQETRTPSKTYTDQHRCRSMAIVVSNHVNDHAIYCPGREIASGGSFASKLARPRFQQKSWTSLFLPSLRPEDTHNHETRSRGTDIARLWESEDVSGVAVSGNWNGSHHNGSSAYATIVSTPISSRTNHKDSSVASTTKTSEVPVAPTKPRSDTSGVVEPVRRVPRPARPSYNQEQKFFIMYHRVIEEESWEKIGELFREFFSLRTKDGLNSVYYRIRHDWGMKSVMGTRTGDLGTDRLTVEEMTKTVSLDFLQKIGYRLGQ